MKRLLLPILLLLAVTSALAQDPERVGLQTRINKQSATVMGDRGLFTVPSVETLNQGQFAFTAGWSNVSRTPKSENINTFPVSFSVGLLSRLTVTATYEVERQIKASNLTQPGFYTPYPYVSSSFQKGPGDAYFAGKYRLWRQPDNLGGMAIRGFVKAGTADPNKGLGTGQTDGGAELVFTSTLPWILKSFLLDSSIGYTKTSNGKTPYPLNLKDEVRSGVGVAFPTSGLPIFPGRLQGIVEYTTTTLVGCCAKSNPAPASIQDPTDVTGGIRLLFLGAGLTLDAGYRVNTKFDKTFPGNRGREGMTFGLSFTKPMKAVVNNHYPIIALESDRSEVSVGSSANITATGFDADNDLLTYMWSATGGKVEGTGEKVTFITTGLPAGTYTVRATASDGKGGTATAQIAIVVRQ
jgi:hypothetical protein